MSGGGARHITRVPKGTGADAEAWVAAMQRKYADVADAGREFIEAVREHKAREAASQAPAAAGEGFALPAGAHLDPDTRAFNIQLSGRLNEYLGTAGVHIRDLERYLEELREGGERYALTQWAEASRRKLIEHTQKRLAEAREAYAHLQQRANVVVHGLHDAGVQPQYTTPFDRRPRPTAAPPAGMHPIHPVLWGAGYRPRDVQRARYRHGFGRPGHDPGDPVAPPDIETLGERIARRAQEARDPRPLAPRAPYPEEARADDLIADPDEWELFPKGMGFLRAYPRYRPPPEREPQFQAQPQPMVPQAAPQAAPQAPAAPPAHLTGDPRRAGDFADEGERRRAVMEELTRQRDEDVALAVWGAFGNYLQNHLGQTVDAILQRMLAGGETLGTAVRRQLDILEERVENIPQGDPRIRPPPDMAAGSVERALEDLKVAGAQLGIGSAPAGAPLPIGARSRRGGRAVSSYARLRQDHQTRLNRVEAHLKKLEGLRLRILSNQSQFQKRLAVSQKQLNDIDGLIRASEREAAMLNQRLKEIGGPLPAGERFDVAGGDYGDDGGYDVGLGASLLDDEEEEIASGVDEDRAVAGALLGGRRRGGAMEVALPSGGDAREDDYGYGDEYGDGDDYGDDYGAPEAMPAEGIVDWFKKRRGKRQARQGLGAVEDVHHGQREGKRQEKRQVRKQTKQRTGALSKQIRELRKKRSAEAKRGRKQVRALSKEERELRQRERTARRLRRGVSAAGSNLSEHLVSIGAAYRSAGRGDDEDDCDSAEAGADPQVVEAKVDHHAAHATAHLFDVLGDEEGDEEEEGGDEYAAAGGALSPVTKYVQAWADAARAHIGDKAAFDAPTAEESRDALEDYAEEIGARLEGAGEGAGEEVQEAWRALHQENRQLLDEMAEEGDRAAPVVDEEDVEDNEI